MNRHPESVLECVKLKDNKPELSESSTSVKDTTDDRAKRLFATLKNSSKILNIVVEGKQDYKIYNSLIVSLGMHAVDCHEAGCRNEIFKVYRLINKLDCKDKKILLDRTAFIADQDSWIFMPDFISGSKKPPEDYSYINMDDIIWTDGYSIENDLYVLGKLKEFALLNESNEMKLEYEKTIDLICTWYAFEVRKCSPKDSLPFTKNLDYIVPNNKGHIDLSDKLLEELEDNGFKRDCKNLIKTKDEIKRNYGKFIRGKTLLELVKRFVKKRGRPATHGGGWPDLLTDIAIFSSPGLRSDLERKVKSKFPNLESLPSSVVSSLVKDSYSDSLDKAI